MAKGNLSKVHPVMAYEALKLAGGDRNKAYSQYVKLMYQATGSLNPRCDNVDLQAFYDAEGDGHATPQTQQCMYKE